MEQHFPTKLTKYEMMIVMNYLKNEDDFINTMLCCKKFEDLTYMFHYNPISNPRLFKSIQTQYFYEREDEQYEIKDLDHYVYYYLKEFKSKRLDKLIVNERLTKHKRMYKKLVLINHKRVKYDEEKEEVKLIDDDYKNFVASYYNSKDDFNKAIIIDKDKEDNDFVTFEYGIYYLCPYCFYNYENLLKVVIPTGVKIIGHSCFEGTNLKELEICEGCEMVLDRAFYGTRLKLVILPRSLWHIGDYCFYNEIDDIYMKEPVKIYKNIKYIGKFALDMFRIIYLPKNIKPYHTWREQGYEI